MYIRIDNKYKYMEATNGRFLKKDNLYTSKVYVPVEEDETLWEEVDCAPEDEIVDSEIVMNELNKLIGSIV